MTRLFSILALLLTTLSVNESTAVTLILKANGLNTPARENGRTEYELADVNGDGHPDIITLSDHGNPGGGQLGIMVWFGDGQGNWTVAKEGNFGYGGCALGDLNKTKRKELKCQIEELINPDVDRVYIFPMCNEDFKACDLLGQAFDPDLITDEIKAWMG